MLWEIILWILIGFVVGWLAKQISPNKISTGFWGTTLIGVLGSVLGGGLASLLDLGSSGAAPGNFNFWSVIVAVVGAIVLMWILSLFKKR